MTFGIDFGTSNSVVARWTGHGTEVIRLDSDGLPAEWNRPGFDELFPSVVSLRDVQRTLCFGWAAKCETSAPQDAVKRMLASRSHSNEDWNAAGELPEEHEVWLGDEPFRSTAVAASLFDQMRVGVRRNLREMDAAVVTVPANATGAARYRTRAAARLAGIKVKALINEPTAAAISYAHEYPGEGCFLVFDWGGGTIDVTILEHYDGIFDEIASRGITALGGLEFDEELARLILAKLGTDPGRLTRAEARRWRRHVELTKIALSQPGVDEVLFDPPGGLPPVIVQRTEFEEAVHHLIRRALRPLRECMADVGLEPDALDAVLMIGGTSQIPLVRQEVEHALERNVLDPALCNPMTAVARGAAITAAEIDGLVPETTISVATSHDLGLVFAAGGRRGFATVIPRYSTLPARGSRSAQPSARGASKVVLEIVEGDGQRAADDERTFPLARLELPVLQPTAAPEANVFDVDYRYDRDGILKISAVARHGGQRMFDGELDCFGPDGTPIAQGLDRELDRLRNRITEPQPTSSSASQQVVHKTVTPATTDSAPTASQDILPMVVVDGRGIMTAHRGVGQRSPSFRQLGNALSAIRRRFPGHNVVTVVGSDIIDAVEYQERDLLDRAISEGSVVAASSTSTHAVLKVAEQLNASVVSIDDLRRYRVPYPWLSEQHRCFRLARIEREWIFT